VRSGDGVIDSLHLQGRGKGWCGREGEECGPQKCCCERAGQLHGPYADRTGLMVFTAQCTLVHMRGLGIACRPSVRPSVCPSVTLVECDHIAWKSWRLIARAISPTPSLFVGKRRSTYSQGNMGKFGGD